MRGRECNRAKRDLEKGILRKESTGGGRDGADECLLRAFPY